MRMGKIAEYRMDEQFQNFLICGILTVLQIENVLKFFSFCKLLKFLKIVNFPI